MTCDYHESEREDLRAEGHVPAALGRDGQSPRDDVTPSCDQRSDSQVGPAADLDDLEWQLLQAGEALQDLEIQSGPGWIRTGKRG